MKGDNASSSRKTAGAANKVSKSQNNAHALVKLRLVDNSSEFQQLQLNEGALATSAMFESYSVQQSQPISATNQQRLKKMPSNVGSQSLVGNQTKSSERQSTNFTGQKSVTNKNSKLIAGIEELEVQQPQIHVSGISSATNKIKKSFNFETGLASGQEMASLDNSSSVLDASATSRAKKQKLMNQILQ